MNDNDLKKVMGLRLRQAREQADLEQQDVAEELGIKRSAYGHVEGGRNFIRVNHLLKVSQLLHKPISYFFDISDSLLADDEAEILELFRALPDEFAKPYFLDSLRAFLKRASK